MYYRICQPLLKTLQRDWSELIKHTSPAPTNRYVWLESEPPVIRNAEWSPASATAAVPWSPSKLTMSYWRFLPVRYSVFLAPLKVISIKNMHIMTFYSNLNFYPTNVMAYAGMGQEYRNPCNHSFQSLKTIMSEYTLIDCENAWLCLLKIVWSTWQLMWLHKTVFRRSSQDTLWGIYAQCKHENSN
jgi:hypothetical protein